MSGVRPKLDEIFLGPRADDLFVSVAAVQDARELQEIDVPEAQREAHVAIDAAIFHAAQRLPNPGSRIALIKGDPGSGKTHVLTTALERAAVHSADVYPAVLQLSAPVALERYEQWFVEALFRELGARNFGRTRREPADVPEHPLRRAARRLLERIPAPLGEALTRAVEGDGDAPSAAVACGRALRQAAGGSTTEDPPSEGFLGALLLAGLGEWSALGWLRRGQADPSLAVLGLPAIEAPHERMAVVRDLGIALQIGGGTLVLGFDQVENTVRLGSEALFTHAMVQLVRLAESLVNVAVVVAVLGPEYDRIAGAKDGAPGLPESDRYRIEKERPAETYIRTPSPRILERVVGQRLTVLRAREGLEPADRVLDPLPDWFVARVGAVRTVRFALREVNSLRERASLLGRLPTEAELDAPGEAAEIVPDFDKLWSDHRDEHVSASEPVDPGARAERLAFWIRAASEERATTEGLTITIRDATADEPTVLVIELAVDGVRSRREIGLCEAPSRGGALTKQVERFLTRCTGTPVAVRTGPFPRARNGQPGDALRAIGARQCAVLELTDVDWHLLGLARAFAARHADDPAFVAWRRRAQWSLQLLPDPGPLLPVLAAPSAAVSGTFPVLLGRAVEGGAEVRWDPYRSPPEQLVNYGVLVTGDPGTGKTRTVQLLVEAACRRELPVFLLDLRGDAAFTEALGMQVVDVGPRGLPFDPLEPPPPRADAPGVQPVSHAFDVAGIFTRAFAFGPVQETQLRSAMVAVYRQAGIDPQGWHDPIAVTWPSLANVLEVLRADPRSEPIAARLDVFESLGLLPRPDRTPLAALLRGKVVLRASGLPTDEVRQAVAELVILQLHGHTLAGPPALAMGRLVVFEEVHRIRHSRRLETLARDARAHGVGLVLTAPLPADLPGSLTAQLATRLFLQNEQVEQRNWVVRHVLGNAASDQGRELFELLGRLRPLEGVLVSPHHRPYTALRLSTSR